MGTKKAESLWISQKQKAVRRGGMTIEENFTNDHHKPHNHDGVIVHLESDILERQVK